MTVISEILPGRILLKIAGVSIYRSAARIDVAYEYASKSVTAFRARRADIERGFNVFVIAVMVGVVEKTAFERSACV